ncbi:hypothetical protein [Salinarimonas rosea]|uniref:hypothetical protein n=1 Tax=Salinarimonas rosea TaxID=552063 RepID=UPI0012EBEB95|nr:hypothetical protein [Salinarimonas rosea]
MRNENDADRDRHQSGGDGPSHRMMMDEQDARYLKLLEEPLVEDIFELAVMMDEKDRKLAFDLIVTILSNKKSI